MVEAGRAPAVGLIGLGRMGQAIASRLADADLLVAVCNRTASTSRRVAQRLGVQSCGTPAELAASASVVITSVTDGAALRSVYEGKHGVLQALRPRSLCLEMSTIDPAQLEQLGGRVGEHGARLLDAPVSGSVELALQGELTILVGGEETSVARAWPVFEALGRRTFHLGPLGSGALMKLVVNNVVYGLNQSIAESLVLAERAGMERWRAYEVLADSAVSAPFVHYRRALFEHPGQAPVQMRARLALKDLDLIAQLARDARVRTPQTAVNREVLARAIQAGRAEEDVSAVASHLCVCEEQVSPSNQGRR